jgi:hypothetical protein
MKVEVIKNHNGSPEFNLAVLGDLHLDPADMKLHEEGRDHIKHLIPAQNANRHMVSLGDLGAYGSAGTSQNFHHTKEYLDSFGIDYDVVTGNHDLEGLDEFETDEENLAAFLKILERKERYFATEIADKTLCVGMSTVRFRDAVWSSHEVLHPRPFFSFYTRLQQFTAPPCPYAYSRC